MAKNSKKSITKLEDLTPDDINANRGTPAGLSLLERSLEKYGAGRSVLVDRNGKIIAGNKTVQAAVEKGMGVRVVETTGHEVVVVQRTDLDMDTDAKARELGIADNRVAELDLSWDEEALVKLAKEGIDLETYFPKDYIAEMFKSVESEDDVEQSMEETLGLAEPRVRMVKCPHCGVSFDAMTAEVGEKGEEVE